MKNPEYDPNIILPSHLSLLEEVAAGRDDWRNGIASLLHRGLVDYKGYHKVQLTKIGEFALRHVTKGAVVVVSDNYRLSHMVGAVGKVDNIRLRMVDSDTFDEYGYPVKRSHVIAVVEVRMNKSPGTWMFYHPRDLKGQRE